MSNLKQEKAIRNLKHMIAYLIQIFIINNSLQKGKLYLITTM